RAQAALPRVFDEVWVEGLDPLPIAIAKGADDELVEGAPLRTKAGRRVRSQPVREVTRGDEDGRPGRQVPVQPGAELDESLERPAADAKQDEQLALASTLEKM